MTDPIPHSRHVNVTHKRSGLRSIGSKQLTPTRTRAAAQPSRSSSLPSFPSVKLGLGFVRQQSAAAKDPCSSRSVFLTNEFLAHMLAERTTRATLQTPRKS